MEAFLQIDLLQENLNVDSVDYCTHAPARSADLDTEFGKSQRRLVQAGLRGTLWSPSFAF